LTANVIHITLALHKRVFPERLEFGRMTASFLQIGVRSSKPDKENSQA
jgi:hypothetical protein